MEWIGYLHFNTEEELKNLAALTRKGGLEVANIMCSSDFVVPDDAKRAERVNITAGQNMLRRPGCFHRQSESLQRPSALGSAAQKIGKDFKEGAAWKNLVDSFRLDCCRS